MSTYQWQQVTAAAPFAPRDGAGILVHRDRLWLLGGWNPFDREHFPTDCNSEVWSSPDGAHWDLVSPSAPWEERHTAGYAVWRDHLWIIGGDVIQGHYQGDVWRSADGQAWSLVTDQVPWGPRALHHTVVFADRLWVMGGQTVPQLAPESERFCSDVWCSADGVHWELVADELPWGPRGMIGGHVVLDGRMWLLGGGTYDTPQHRERNFHNDVWSSSDGVDWTLDTPAAPWSPRQYHDTATFDGKMWVVAGYGPHDEKLENLSDVWCSANGRDWSRIETPWAPRHASSVQSFHNSLWVIAGNNLTSDVWRLNRVAPVT